MTAFGWFSLGLVAGILLMAAPELVAAFVARRKP